MRWGWLARHWTIAVAVRIVLLMLGVGDALLWCPEVSTPANTVLKAREGVWLLQMGISPYTGAACHLPPLWLAISEPWVKHKLLYAVPNMVCDVVAATALLLAAALVLNRPAGSVKQDAPWLSPEQLSLLYLLNPFTILTCVAGSSTSAENMGVILAVAGGLMRNAPMAAAGVAVGTYMGLQPALLVLPVLLLLWRGPEDILQQVPPPVPGMLLPSKQKPSQTARQRLRALVLQARKAVRLVRAIASQQLQPDRQDAASSSTQQPCSAAGSQHSGGATLCWAFGLLLAVSMAALLLLSDSMLQRHPESQCLPALLQWVQHAAGRSSSGQQQHQLSCWAVRVYKFSLLLEDYTPNIGLWWYFFTEMFDAFRPFFLFVFHSFYVMLAVPMAVRFPHRPLFVAWVQLLITCMFKPYACVGDMVPWLSLLPLLQQQLQCIKLGMFFVNSMLLLMVLGPAMWHQWIVVDAANANFFYSITLLMGAWYTVFLAHMLRLTALLDRRLARKQLVLRADELEQEQQQGAAKVKGE